MLDKVTTIVSVSGGSILSAMLLINWDKCLGSKEEFAELQRSVVSIANRDIRGRVVRRFVLLFWTLLLPRLLHIGPTDLLRREYRRIFANNTFFSARSKNKNITPELHLVATNIRTGEMCSFSRQGYHVERDVDRLFESQLIPLAMAVAASSAYPALFPPVEVTKRQLGADTGKFPHSHLLTDGGVFDNLGFEKAVRMVQRGELIEDVILISDASGPFDWDVDSRFIWPVARSVRAADILMNRVSAGVLDRIKTIVGTKLIVHCSISAHAPGAAIADIQNRLKSIRTDLDRFSNLEVNTLMAHGEAVAIVQLLKTFGPAPSSNIVEIDHISDPVDLEEASTRLQQSAERKWRLFSWSDWISYLTVGLMLAVLLVFYFQVINPRYQLQRASIAAESDASAAKSFVNENESLKRQLDTAESTIATLSAKLQTQPRICRTPANGIEHYAVDMTQTVPSPEMGGGHNQGAWCNNVIADFKSKFGDEAKILVISSSESSRSSCAPFNCPQYTYSCTVRIQASPVYREAASQACP